jgi:hypothetical protein
MKTRSLCTGAIRAVLVLVAAATLAVCAPPLDTRNEGNLRIVLAGGSSAGARALSPETIAGLSYRLDFSGPNGETLSRTLEPGTQTLILNLTLGDWTIQAEAFNDDGVVYGNGETTVTVEAGRINDAMIPMREATPEDQPKEIMAFSFDGLTPPVEGAIDADTKTVAVTVPYDTVVTSLVPTITVSSGASIDPASGEAQDFTNPVSYTVTAEDGSTETWTVTVTIASNTAKEIEGFSFESLTPPVEGTIDQAAKTVAVTVPSGTVVTSLVPTITVSFGASIDSVSGTAQNFTNPVTYTVTAEDGSTETWTVTVTTAPNTAKEITGFSFTNPPTAGTIDPAAKTVVVSVFDSTDRTNLSPTITVSSGATVSPLSGASQNFINPVTYTVTAADNSTEQWTVTVTVRSPLTTIAEVTDYLASASGSNSTANPIPLPVALNLASDWTALLGAIHDKGKFVALDLSECGITGMTATAGEFDPDYTISTGKDKIVSMELPDTATSIAVGTFSDPTFKHFSGLTSVTGTNVTTVGQNAFTSCTSLVSVSLSTITTIGGSAFLGCTSLTLIDFPTSLTSIGDGAFVHCTGLTSVNLPASLTYISREAFAECTGLILVNLPASLTIIGDHAFMSCSSLISVDLPASLASIGDNPFSGCINLTNIAVDGANPNYKAENGMLLSKDGTILIGWPTASGAAPPLLGITTIGAYAFADCTGLTAVSLPDATSVGYRAFWGCNTLTSVNLPVVTTVPDEAFGNTGGVAITVTLGTVVPNLGGTMFSYNDESKIVTVKVSNNVAWSGIIGGSPYSGADTTDNWGNGFRGGGWNGTAMMTSSLVNSNITLTIETYTP